MRLAFYILQPLVRLLAEPAGLFEIAELGKRRTQTGHSAQCAGMLVAEHAAFGFQRLPEEAASLVVVPAVSFGVGEIRLGGQRGRVVITQDAAKCRKTLSAQLQCFLVVPKARQCSSEVIDGNERGDVICP